MDYPATPRKHLVETIHGHRITDDYRWLEDGSSKEVKNWTTEQNKFTDQAIGKSLRTTLAKELKTSYAFPSNGVFPCFGTYFWWERQPNQEQGILYMRKGLKAPKKVLIDPNKLSASSGHITTLDYWFPSPKGKYLAYGTSVSGDELSVLKVLNVETGEDIETVAENASSPSIAWLTDESGFYCVKNPKPGTVPKGEERYHDKAYFHRIGSNAELDKEIFGKGRAKEDYLGLELSMDDKYLAISVSQDWERNDLFLYNTKTRQTTNLIVGFDAQFSLTFAKDRALLMTSYKAPNSRILSADIEKMPTDPDNWQDFIPERKDKLEWYRVTKDEIMLCYLMNATERALHFNHQGKELGPLEMPKYASLLGISARRDESEYFYDFASFTTPGVTMHYDPETRQTTEFDRMGTTLKESDYLSKQVWYTSKDGTRVPMFIVHRKDLKLNSKNPTILYGYGGFESSVTPGFLRHLVPWLERGGIYAVANIRGGGEFGKPWHLAGIRQNKQNSYDDFISAAEYLIGEKFTSREHLGILGGSNGGLLVSAVAVQRPELFSAVVSRVPLTDMVRFTKLFIASRWVAEYGDPQKPEDLKNILKFSPYHNVQEKEKYPAFLFTTAENDTRVDPMHARKMTALLQSLKGKKPVLLSTDTASGHLGSLTMSNYYRDQARILAFFMEQLG